MKNSMVKGFGRWMDTNRYSHIMVGLPSTLLMFLTLEFLTGRGPGVIPYGVPFYVSAVFAFLEWYLPDGFLRRVPPAS